MWERTRQPGPVERHLADLLRYLKCCDTGACGFSYAAQGNAELRAPVFYLLLYRWKDVRHSHISTFTGSIGLTCNNLSPLLSRSSLWGGVDLSSRDHPLTRISRALRQQPELCLEGFCARRGWNTGKACQTLISGWPMYHWLKSWAGRMSKKIRYY